MGEYKDEEQKLRESTKMVYFHTRMLISLNRSATSLPRALMEDAVNAACTVVVSKSVHDPGYAHVLSEETCQLSLGSATESGLAMALAEMLALAGTVDPRTIGRIPSDCDGYDIAATKGIVCSSILTEPLMNFVFCASNKPAVPSFSAQVPSSEFEIKNEAPDKKFSVALGVEHSDIESQMPNNVDPSLLHKPGGVFETGNFWSGGTKPGVKIKSQQPNSVDSAMGPLLSVEANLAVAAVGGAAIAGLMASGAEDSLSVRVFSAASAVGFSCSLLAAFTHKNPKVSRFLSKIGAIGTVYAVMVALGNTIDTTMFGNVNVHALVIALICIIHVVILFG